MNNVIEALSKIDEASAIDLFAVTELPLLNLPPEIALSLKHTKKLLIVEEHVKRGGLAEHITLLMMQQGVKVDKFAALNAAGYPTKEYGSQSFHQTQSGLNPENIRNVILNIVIN